MPIVYESASKGGGGTVTSVTAADTSIVIAGTAAAPTVATGTLDVIAADHPAAADWSNNSHKITSLANGTAATDAAAFGQIPTTLQPTDPGTNKVWGSNGAGASLGVLPPGFEIGYAQRTTAFTVTDTSEATATAAISVTATFDGAPVIAQVYAPYFQSPSPLGATVTATLFEGSTELARLLIIGSVVNGVNFISQLSAFYRFTPSAASHTYKLCAFCSSTTGGPQIGAGAGGTGAYAPAFLRFVKV